MFSFGRVGNAAYRDVPGVYVRQVLQPIDVIADAQRPI